MFVLCVAALIKADHVDKTIHMSIAFGRISSSQFWEAIREQLEAPMTRAGADADLQQFARTFDGVKFRKGQAPECCPVSQPLPHHQVLSYGAPDHVCWCIRCALPLPTAVGPALGMRLHAGPCMCQQEGRAPVSSNRYSC